MGARDHAAWYLRFFTETLNRFVSTQMRAPPKWRVWHLQYNRLLDRQGGGLEHGSQGE